MALRAVLLPAPLGPMSPRMRPSSTCRSTPSSAMVVPKALRRPRASMHAMDSALLLRGIRLGGFRFQGRVIRRRLAVVPVQKLFRFQTEPLNDCVNTEPLSTEKFLPFGLQQQVARAGIDEHAQ